MFVSSDGLDFDKGLVEGEEGGAGALECGVVDWLLVFD